MENEVIEERKNEVMIPQQMTQQSLEEAVKSANRYMELQDSIRKSAIKVTNQNDWIDQSGKPYLQWTGASKIARAFGVSYDPPSFTKDTEKDDRGEYIVYTCMSTIHWRGQSVPEMGTGSTRDPFFGRKGGEDIPLSEIDLNNIKKKALTNFLNRGIKSLLGLSFTWQEIEEISGGKIGRSGSSKVGYDKGKKGGSVDTAETSEKRSEIRRLILEMYVGDKKQASDYLYKLTENKEKGYKGKKKVEDLTANQIPWIYKKVKHEYEAEKKKAIEQFNGGGEG